MLLELAGKQDRKNKGYAFHYISQKAFTSLFSFFDAAGLGVRHAAPMPHLPSLAASVSCRARRAHSLLRTTGLTVLPTAHPRARSPGDSLFGLERAARAAGPRLALLADQNASTGAHLHPLPR